MKLRPIVRQDKEKRKSIFGSGPEQQKVLTYIGYAIILGLLAFVGFLIYYFLIK